MPAFWPHRLALGARAGVRPAGRAIFVAGAAGNVPTPEILGRLEYATKVAGAKAIVVLGHNHRGAVDKADVGALYDIETGKVTFLS